MHKKAVNTIVATVLVLLITIVTITVIWLMAKPMIKKQTQEIETTTLGMGITLDIKRAVIDEQGNLTVKINRGNDNAQLEAIKLVLESEQGESYIYTVNASTPGGLPEPLETKSYEINLSMLGVPSGVEIVKVSVAPVFRVGEKAKQGGVVSSGVVDRERTGGSGGQGGEVSLCGNGELNEGEECDSGIFLDDATCQSLGFAAGQLLCNPDCTINTSMCIPWVELNSCETITQEGYYKLANDISSDIYDGYCIEIQADNVVLNLMGHTIDCLDDGNGNVGNGILVNGTEVTIDNGKIWCHYGIDLNRNRKNINIQHLAITGKGTSASGILVYANNSNILNVTFANLKWAITLFSDNNTVSYAEIINISSIGIYLSRSYNNTLSNINLNNSSYAIYLHQSDNNFLSNIEVNNSYDGITVLDSNENTFENVTSCYNNRDFVCNWGLDNEAINLTYDSEMNCGDWIQQTSTCP